MQNNTILVGYCLLDELIFWQAAALSQQFNHAAKNSLPEFVSSHPYASKIEKAPALAGKHTVSSRTATINRRWG